MKTALVTGSSGLIGSEAVLHFDRLGYAVVGVDNNMRAEFFGPGGDTCSNLERLRRAAKHFEHRDLDIRDRDRVASLVREVRPSAIVHCAAQPSHDLAARRPFDDFDVNANGTLNLLEAVRQTARDAPFVLMSSNKVYGDGPNRIEMRETDTRWVAVDPRFAFGVPETLSIDQCLHSLMGASKVAADVLTQEYGRYFGMPTVCFRAGCLTGPSHAGVELHGFLAYLTACALSGRPYTVFGYKGKQVRDQLHAADVVAAIEAFVDAPRVGEVYNLGGGPSNNVSVVEAIALVERAAATKVTWTYSPEHRRGDHIWYVSDIRKFTQDYPKWSVTRSLDDIVGDLIAARRS